jgi:hypothetical protein
MYDKTLLRKNTLKTKSVQEKSNKQAKIPRINKAK